MFIEMAEVKHRRVSAVVAHTMRKPVVQRLAATALTFAKVIGVWVEPKEADQRVELTDSVLQWSAREAPLVHRIQVEYGSGCGCAAVFDLMSLVKNDPKPRDLQINY